MLGQRRFFSTRMIILILHGFEQRLNAEPSTIRRADLLPGASGHFGGQLNRHANSFGKQLHLARSLHNHEPPRGFLDCFAYRQQTVVLENKRFVVGQTVHDFGRCTGVVHDAVKGIVYCVIFEKDARVLVDWVERTSKACPSLSISCVSVNDRVNIAPSSVNYRMNCEGRFVNRQPTLKNVPLPVHSNKVTSVDGSKVATNRVDPKAIRFDGVPDRDMPGDTLAKSQLPKQTQNEGELRLGLVASFDRIVRILRMPMVSAQGRIVKKDATLVLIAS